MNQQMNSLCLCLFQVNKKLNCVVDKLASSIHTNQLLRLIYFKSRVDSGGGEGGRKRGREREKDDIFHLLVIPQIIKTARAGQSRARNVFLVFHMDEMPKHLNHILLLFPGH